MAQKKPTTAKLPWNDRTGRFAPLKATTLVLVSLPGAWILFQALSTGFRPSPFGLGPRPLTGAIHQLGDWTIYLLLATLAITPARRLLEWPKLIQVRRIVGLAAMFYILTHFLLYIADSNWDLVFVSREIVLRIYLTIGFLAILSLIALGVTSTDGMIRRMGAVEWNRLHYLIYPITMLAILHYYMQSKVDVSQPVLMSGFFFWLMGYRLLTARGYKSGLVPLIALSVAAALLTAGVEAAWYGLATGIGATRVILANLDLTLQVRPAWWVLVAGLAVTAASEIARKIKRVRMQSRTVSA
jgi:methionine sulfoxide reductase heme-binding subunit